MRTRAKVGAVCCGVAMVVAACAGGDGRLSAAEYVGQASELCRRANRAVERVEIPPLTTDRDASRAMARIVVVQRATIDELRGLRPPEHLTDLVQKWIALLDQGADELELMGARLRAGAQADASEYGARATTLLDRARELVAPLRVTSCRGPVLATE